MHLYLLVLFVASCFADLRVTVDEKGGYQLLVNDNPWLRSSRTALYADNKWYSSDDNSLPLKNITTGQGYEPRLGNWSETQLNYELVRNGRTSLVVGRIRQWNEFSAITFHLETGDQELTSTNALDMNHVRTVFPSFHIEKFNDDDKRGFFTYEGEMAGDDDKHAGHWDSSATVVTSGVLAGPIVLFDFNQRGERDALVLSTFTRFMATSPSQTNNTLEYGVMGSMSSVPANYNYSTIVSYSSKGINDAIRQWGQTLRKAYNRTTEYRQNDLTVNYLGYYTDNGGYYYYNTEKGINYEQTIIDVRYKIPLPMHYIQLDSWWYFKGIGGGVTQYTPMPDVFPDGLSVLHRKVENIPFAAHNRYWAFDTVYKQNYSFALDEAGGKALPTGNDSFWFDLFTQTHDWGLVLYEQDWLDRQTYNFTPLVTDIHLGHQWLTSMGEAAEKVGMNLQYCMSLPRHMLTSLEVPRVTQARASTDYAFHLESQTAPQWAIGISSMFVEALGVAPFKDVLWSTSNQPDAPYKNSPREVLPEREIAIATLSTGPVGPGDAINYTNVERIMKCCRKDGLILKPQYPLTIVDRLVSDWALNNNAPQGELYSTKTTISNQTFFIVFASAMQQDYLVFPSMIGAVSGLAWSYDNTSDVRGFSAPIPIEITARECHNLSICVWYVSPLQSLDDEAGTQFALLGEWNKWTAVSQQRFTSIETDSTTNRAVITVQGVTDEVVPVVVFHSVLLSVTVHCRIVADNSPARVIVTASNVTCS